MYERVARVCVRDAASTCAQTVVTRRRIIVYEFSFFSLFSPPPPPPTGSNSFRDFARTIVTGSRYTTTRGYDDNITLRTRIIL